MSSPNVRRNDPCPCGSKLRFKECHGKLPAQAAAAVAPAPRSAEHAVDKGMEAFRHHRPADAIQWFDAALALDASHAFAIHFKGYALCQLQRFDEGLPLLERALAMQPANPDFNGNLGIIHYVLGEIPKAIEHYERALAAAPQMAEAHSNLVLAYRDLGRFDRALEHARRALALRPDFAQAHQNLANALLSMGRFEEAWPQYAWRPRPEVNLRQLAAPHPRPHAQALPALDDPRPILLHGEQGLGDTLFFLRFAPLLAKRGARLEFWGDTRLAPLLARSGLVAKTFPADDPMANAPTDRLLWVGDLPALLAIGGAHPPPLGLVPDPGRVESMRARLQALGPAPYVALTWRAGLERRGRAVLAKEVPLQALGEALRGRSGTFVSVQRAPRAGETAQLSAALGAPVHDLSACNADLDDMLALMDVADRYIGVSNTNTHLRAGVSRATDVLVPYPPEWRWLQAGDESPWFPGFRVLRAASDGSWQAALQALRSNP